MKLIDNSPKLLVLQEWNVEMMGGKDKVKEYIKFWDDRGFHFAEITEDSLIKKSSEELLDLPHTDLISSKNLDYIIKNFTPYKKSD